MKNSLDNVVWKSDDNVDEEVLKNKKLLHSEFYKRSTENSRSNSLEGDYNSKFIPGTLTLERKSTHDKRKKDLFEYCSDRKILKTHDNDDNPQTSSANKFLSILIIY